VAKRRFKKFTSAYDPVAFELAGVEFECVPELDYRVYRKLTSGETEDGIDFIVDNLRNFLASDADRNRFDEMLEDESVIIPAAQLVEVFNWLLIEFKIVQPPVDAPKSR
jgi:hypothetical protein